MNDKRKITETEKSEHYRRLQEKSMASRISRHIDCEISLDPKRVSKIPWRKRESDAGFDVESAENVIIPANTIATIRTGIKLRCPEGYFYRLECRSSLLAEGVISLPAIIDATYTGEIHVLLHNTNKVKYTVEVTDRIAQLIFYPQIHPHFIEVEQFSDTNGRGDLGWGSSGRKH